MERETAKLSTQTRATIIDNRISITNVKWGTVEKLPPSNTTAI